MARTAVTALRLFRPGWFLQPEQAMYVFYAPSLPLNVVRSPGPYRQVFVSDPTNIPMARFELKLDDLTQRLDSPGPIASTWELLQDYRRSGGNTSVEIAIESFNRSCGFQVAITKPSSQSLYGVRCHAGRHERVEDRPRARQASRLCTAR